MKNSTWLALYTCAAAAFAGCASVGVWKSNVASDINSACNLADGALVTELTNIATKWGVPLSFVEQAFAAICGPAKDPTRARASGLQAADAAARAAHASHAMFPKDGTTP